MQENANTLHDYISVLRQRKWPFLGVMLLVLLISVGVAFGLPTLYRSTATILIEQQEIPQDLVRSTITTYADQRVQIINQRVMRRENLINIAKTYMLKPSQQDDADASIEAAVAELRNNTVLQLVNADVRDPRSGRTAAVTIAFSVSYESESPELAQTISDALASLYLDENIKSRRETAEQTSLFLEQEAEKLGSSILELEAQLAEFKKRNVHTLPELARLNMDLLDRAQRELEQTELRIRTQQEQKTFLQSSLALVSPTTVRIFTEEGRQVQVLPPADRLNLLQNQYASLSAKYSPQHPDLVRMRNEMDVLKKQVGTFNGTGHLEAQLGVLQTELARAQDKYSDDHPDVKRLKREIASLNGVLEKGSGVTLRPDNPVYIQLQAQLASLDTELGALQETRNNLREQGLLYEERVTLTPQVEREYSAFMRELDGAQTTFSEVRSKQMEAQLGQALEVEDKAERYELIGKPRVPSEPVSPNRPAILFLGLVLSVAGGLGTVVLAENLDETVRGRRGVATLLGAPPLAVIPYIETTSDRRRALRRRVGIVSGMIGSILCLVVIFHWLVTPLDEAWLALLNRFGLHEG